MLVWLFDYLSGFYSGFHVFSYLTLRSILSVLTALTFSLLLGPVVIRYLVRLKVGQSVRECGPQSHLAKSGTPTMGGCLILMSIFCSTLLWARLDNYYIWIVLAVLFAFGAIGWVDDYRKVVHRNSEGLPARWKYFWQSLSGIAAAGTLYYISTTPAETALLIPFMKNYSLQLGMLSIILTYLVIVGTSNAVNLTDGLDGLAIMPTAMIAAALALFCYATGHIQFAHYLGLPFISGVGELAIICAAIVGAGLGFLWFNTYPAMVFMGDVGALSLGAGLGTIAVITRQELVLFIMAGGFVLETLSVILQVGSFKLRGKRILKMAPLHHHFELMGWPEPRVIVRFWILTVVLILIGLSSLKIR